MGTYGKFEDHREASLGWLEWEYDEQWNEEWKSEENNEQGNEWMKNEDNIKQRNEEWRKRKRWSGL